MAKSKASPRSGMDISPDSPLHHVLTDEDRAKASIAKSLNAAKRRTFKEAIQAFLGTKPTYRKTRELLKELGIPEAAQTKRDSAVITHIIKAESGDAKSMAIIYEMSGEKVVRNENLNIEMRPLIDLRTPADNTNQGNENNGNHDGVGED